MPSGRFAFTRICLLILVIIAGLGYFEHVRAQSTSASSTIVLPLRPLAPLSTVPVPPVFGMEGILVDRTAAIQLGKALFWDMQAGSDDTQACASCHFNAGADSRAINEVNPGQNAGDNNFDLGGAPNYRLTAGTSGAGFGGYHDGDYPLHKLSDPNDRYSNVISDVNDVTGSQGVFATTNTQISVTRAPVPGSSTSTGVQCQTSSATGAVDQGTSSELLLKQPRLTNQPVTDTCSMLVSTRNLVVGQLPSVETDSSIPDPVFSVPDPDNSQQRINTRKVTGRNTPSAVDAVFNFRNFWDGRAQNVCNGANPFGARDGQSHLMVTDESGNLVPALVSMKNSALCSQSLGPILSNVEMSADDRNFHEVGKKLLARQPLAKQMVDPTDSVLGAFSNAPAKGLRTSYSTLVQKAFQPDWWNFPLHLCVSADGSIQSKVNPARLETCPSSTIEYSQMEYNFSLFWGVAIQMYESTLIADQTPLDKYLEQQITYNMVGDDLHSTFTIHLQPGIAPYTISVLQLDPQLDASDQDIYAFDDGMGRFIGAGMDGTVDYSSGTVVMNFQNALPSGIPVKIAYSVGAIPLTNGQLRGLELFQTKGRCVVCHGGPELSNAAVDTVAPDPLERMVMGDGSVRIYDTGFYHIGVRKGAEDVGLAGNDPIANKPLSLGEEMRERVCNDPSISVMIPGRPGDGVSQAPLNCGDDIARTGFFKAPQLRNVALTAPYFHNGSQLTLEQVVEFYNRGGDFNVVEELSIMDPDIEPLGLGLTLQEKQDLVDFLRNALTDPRTVAQAAPFDHPQLFAPNGHPAGANGSSVQKDPAHPGQAATQLLEIPAVGQNGGPPLPTFLDNLLKNQHN